MNNKQREIKCSICGSEFELAYSTYRNRIKNHPVDTKFYCKSCKNIGRQEDLKLIKDQLTKEELDNRKKAASERTKKQWASYVDNKRKEIHNTFSKAQIDRINSMSKEELSDYKRQQSERQRIKL